MDKATLVDRDVRLGDGIVAALGAFGVGLEEAMWVFSPQLEEWRLFLSTPLVDQKGPRGAYLTMLQVLRESGLTKQVPLRRVSLVSPKDPLWRDLRTAFGLPAPSGFRSGRAIGRYTFDEAYIYGGSLHIVRLNGNGKGEIYRLVFAPYKGPGGAVPHRELRGRENLKRFLEAELRVTPSAIDHALNELQSQRATSVQDLHAQTSDLIRLGLLPHHAKLAFR